MRPEYVRVDVSEHISVIGFVEWTDLLPPSESISMKPLYITAVADARRFSSRVIDGTKFVDLKVDYSGPSPRAVIEREMANEVRAVRADANIDELTSLLKVPFRDIRQIWRARSIDEFAQVGEPGPLEIMEVLRMALGSHHAAATTQSAAIIGSLIYEKGERPPGRDLDVALECTPAVSLELRKGLARMRLTSAKYRPPESYFNFPFKIQSNPSTIDFFPSLPQTVPHPLREAVQWVPDKVSHNRTCRVIDASLGGYAWPTYRVTGSPEYIVLLSNGFRGSIAIGDCLDLTVRTIQVVSSNGSVSIDLVLNPWSEIVHAADLFALERDRLWLS